MWRCKCDLWRTVFLITLSFLLASSSAWADSESKNKQFTTDFALEDCTFSVSGGNAYFSLDPEPGPMNPILLEGEEDNELVQVEITALDETMSINLDSLGLDTVITRIIEEMEWIDGELVEVSRNYFARCEETDAIYYFGEDVEIYEYDDDGDMIDILTGADAGAWIAGEPTEDGESYNAPGLMMPGTFLLGARYYQEVAPDIALDRAENIGMGLDVETPAGTFHNSVKTQETTPLEPSSKDIKIYAPGAGMIVDAAIERVHFFSSP